MTIRTTLPQVYSLAKQIVAEYGPEHTYCRPKEIPHCAYFHPTTWGGWEPGCIVGQILARLGLTRDQLGDGTSIYKDLNGHSVGILVSSGLIYCDFRTLQFLAVLQGNQDNGHTWGEALTKAEYYLFEHYGVMIEHLDPHVESDLQIQAIKAAEPKPESTKPAPAQGAYIISEVGDPMILELVDA